MKFLWLYSLILGSLIILSSLLFQMIAEADSNLGINKSVNEKTNNFGQNGILENSQSVDTSKNRHFPDFTSSDAILEETFIRNIKSFMNSLERSEGDSESLDALNGLFSSQLSFLEVINPSEDSKKCDSSNKGLNLQQEGKQPPKEPSKSDVLLDSNDSTKAPTSPQKNTLFPCKQDESSKKDETNGFVRSEMRTKKKTKNLKRDNTRYVRRSLLQGQIKNDDFSYDKKKLTVTNRKSKRSTQENKNRKRIITDEKTVCYQEIHDHFGENPQYQYFIDEMVEFFPFFNLPNINYRFIRFLSSDMLEISFRIQIRDLIISSNRTFGLFSTLPQTIVVNLDSQVKSDLCKFYFEYILEYLSKCFHALHFSEGFQIYNTFITRSYEEINLPLLKVNMNFLTLSYDSKYPDIFLVKRNSILNRLRLYENEVVRNDLVEDQTFWNHEDVIWAELHAEFREKYHNETIYRKKVGRVRWNKLTDENLMYTYQPQKNFTFHDVYVLMVAYKNVESGNNAYFTDFYIVDNSNK